MGSITLASNNGWIKRTPRRGFKAELVTNHDWKLMQVAEAVDAFTDASAVAAIAREDTKEIANLLLAMYAKETNR